MKALCMLAATTIALGGVAEAGPLADALAKADAATVTSLRTQTADPAARCTLGAVYAKRNDVPRAMLYLADCADAELPADIGVAIRKSVREIKAKAREQLAELSIASDPAGIEVTLDALPGETVATPATVYIAPGTTALHYTINGLSLTKPATTAAYAKSIVILDGGPPPAKPPRTSSVDFGEEQAQEQHTGQPPDVKRPPLTSDKYRGVVDPSATGNLEDPLAVRISRGPRPWFGVRFGGGIYDDGATTATLRPTVAATARFALAPRVFLSARLDWSRRGGDATHGVDATSLGAGAGYTVLASRALALAAIVQLRGELRFTDARDAMDVNRVGAGAAAGVEVAFPRTPITAGVRFENGFTELVPGTRDRALVVELGVDWR